MSIPTDPAVLTNHAGGAADIVLAGDRFLDHARQVARTVTHRVRAALTGHAPTVLWCDACGRADELTGADVVRYVQAGWPVCCGNVMRLPSPPRGED